MRLGRFSRTTVLALCAFLISAPLLTTPALSQTAGNGAAPRLSQERIELAQYRECSQRAGPYATQSTAWQRWREAGSRGHSVSNGVVPCYEDSIRGYCFFVSFRC